MCGEGEMLSCETKEKRMIFKGKILNKVKKGTKCPKCGEEMCPYHHYYITDKKTLKSIEVCRKCLNKQKEHRMFVKVKGKTRVID